MRCSIFCPWNMSSTLLQEEDDPRRLSENAHLPFDRLTALSIAEGLRYPHPLSLRRTGMYASLHGICPQKTRTPRALDADSPRFRRGSPVSEALYLDIFHQPPEKRGI